MRGATCYTIHSKGVNANFNPRPPVRGATGVSILLPSAKLFQSTPPCAGGDHNRCRKLLYPSHFNPRPPVRGATRNAKICLKYRCDFNPRPPVRGATFPACSQKLIVKISIHAPLCGGRQQGVTAVRAQAAISIHAPLRGGRPFNVLFHDHRSHFNPRPPARGATRNR